MGEVIRVNFGAKSEKDTDLAQSEFGGEMSDGEKQQKVKELLAKDLFSLMLSSIASEEFLSFIKNAPVSKSTLEKQQEIVKQYSDEELANWIKKSNKNDWIGRPAFFKAILGELQHRAIYKN